MNVTVIYLLQNDGEIAIRVCRFKDAIRRLATLALVLLPTINYAGSCDGTWAVRYPPSFASIYRGSMRDVTWDGKQYVAVGSGYRILTSTDGKSWKTRKATGPYWLDLNGVAGNGSWFAAVGDSGVIFSSVNGKDWTKRRLPKPFRRVDLSDVVWGGGLFVAVGADTILTSPDGIAWAPSDSGSLGGFDLAGVAYGNGRFVAAGYRYGGGPLLLGSSDGLTWAPLMTEAPDDADLNRIAWSGSRFLATTNRGDRVTSDDGINWRFQSEPNELDISGIAGGQGGFVAVEESGRVYFSEDRSSGWTQKDSGTAAALHGVTWTGSEFVAVGEAILSSPDGTNWTTRAWSASAVLNGVVWNGSRFVAAGDAILMSPDGARWTRRRLSPGPSLPQMRDIAWNGTSFVAVGLDGTVAVSPDGDSWSSRSLENSLGYQPSLNSLVWDGRQFVAVGEFLPDHFEQGSAGGVFTSPDGFVWAERDSKLVEPVRSQSYYHLNGVAWGNGRYVAVGGYNHHVPTTSGFFDYVAGVTLTSWDGIDWAPRVRRNMPFLYGVASNGRWFVAVGDKGAILSSSDGLRWTARRSGTAVALRRVSWDGRRFFVAGDQGVVLSSATGMTWKPLASGLPANLGFRGVASDGQQLVAVGQGALILASSCKREER